jgi:hypothetical protein
MPRGATAQPLERRLPEGRARLAPVPRPVPADKPPVSVTAVSWSARPDLDLPEWVNQGHRIGRMGRSVGWWIGDWLRFGNARYGEKYTRAMKITG